jgi:hypothetical protein
MCGGGKAARKKARERRRREAQEAEEEEEEERRAQKRHERIAREWADDQARAPPSSHLDSAISSRASSTASSGLGSAIGQQKTPQSDLWGVKSGVKEELELKRWNRKGSKKMATPTIETSSRELDRASAFTSSTASSHLSSANGATSRALAFPTGVQIVSAIEDKPTKLPAPPIKSPGGKEGKGGGEKKKKSKKQNTPTKLPAPPIKSPAGKEGKGGGEKKKKKKTIYNFPII